MIAITPPQDLDRWVSIGSGVATIVAAGVAIWGINAWRGQLRGSTEYRLAIRTYRAVLRLRDMIEATRNEGNHMITLSKAEADDQRATLEREYKTYVEWFRDVVRADLALKRLRPEIELHWGDEGTSHVDALDEMARKLRGGYLAYFRHRFRALSGERGFAEAAEKDRLTAFEPIGDEPDKFGAELGLRVDAATAFLRPRVKR